MREYLIPAACVLAYLVLGGKVLILAAKGVARGQLFDENFLMAVATMGALAIGEYAEAAAVMLFFRVGEFFMERAVHKSRNSITSLMDIRPEFANVKREGGLEKVRSETVRPGEVIVVKPGEKVPLDGVVIEGEAMLDVSALTGESVPRRAAAPDEVWSGSVNQNGVLTLTVARPFEESAVSKIIGLVENAASQKAPAENFITKFARYYTPAVVGMAVLLAVVPPLALGGAWAEWVRRGLMFLVISCPCALVISIPLSFFGGIGGAARKGILVKGGNYLEALGNPDIVVFDKTGTLTKGVFQVTALEPSGGLGDGELLAAAARAEALSNHPIALSILRAYDGAVDQDTLAGYREHAGLGVSVSADGRELLAGNAALMKKAGVAFTESPSAGTRVYVAIDGEYAGCVVISDEVKPDSRDAIAALREKGVRKTVMLTGDRPDIAQAVARELGIDEAYGGLLPEHKAEMLEKLSRQKRPGGSLVFVGDGINDAPALAMADVGVAMGGLGADAALEAADAALMTDQPSKLAEAVETARFTKRVVWQNIVFALAAKALFLLLGALGIASMWGAVFADVGVSLLAVLNAMRALRR